jgi:hypothetical protein
MQSEQFFRVHTEHGAADLPLNATSLFEPVVRSELAWAMATHKLYPVVFVAMVMLAIIGNARLMGDIGMVSAIVVAVLVSVVELSRFDRTLLLAVLVQFETLFLLGSLAMHVVFGFWGQINRFSLLLSLLSFLIFLIMYFVAALTDAALFYSSRYYAADALHAQHGFLIRSPYTG